METVRESTSGRMQLDYMKILEHLPAHALVMENLLLLSWALTTTVSQDLTVLHGNPLFSTLMIHCGMDKIAMNSRAHAVIPQTSHGFARSFLSQLLTTWRFVSVGMSLAPIMRILPLTLFNSTYSEL